MTTLVWFRSDLRLHDNPALTYALHHHRKVALLFIHDVASPYPQGSANQWWLHHSLATLSDNIQKKGGELILKTGIPQEVLWKTAKDLGITSIYWNRRYTLKERDNDATLKKSFENSGTSVKTFNSHLLFEPWEVLTKEKRPFQIFTPFWKHCLSLGKHQDILPAPKFIPSMPYPSDPLESFELPFQALWAAPFLKEWEPGELGAIKRAQAFFENTLCGYKKNRDYPAKSATSKLSPHLHFGEISIKQLWQSAHYAMQANPQFDEDAKSFLSELGWREFSHHLLYHHPDLPQKPLRKEFNLFRWEENTNHLKAWQKGMTGYPIIDAAMRELWQTGWMHNRMRMIVASFLVKDLLIPWQEGAKWFLDTLLDADLANNSASWQWVAGCGTDAAPYFRIFNPVLQGEKFDSDGEYIRRFVPEIGLLSNKYIHSPWEAPNHELRAANITLGKTYPLPIVDHKKRRAEALLRFKNLRKDAM